MKTENRPKNPMKEFLDKFFDLCKEYQQEIPPHKMAEVLRDYANRLDWLLLDFHANKIPAIIKTYKVSLTPSLAMANKILTTGQWRNNWKSSNGSKET